MNLYEKSISIGSQNLVINTFKSIYWPDQKMLILADLHVGKAAHFRKNGIPIPNTISQVDLQRLTYLFHFYEVEKVLIVGDIIHSKTNSEVEKFQLWKQQWPHIQWILVKGNHDRLAQRDWEQLGLTNILDELNIQDLLFIHEPPKILKENTFYISGHIHPGVLLWSLSRSKIRLPAFVLQEQQLILPAFSQFTGLDTESIVGAEKYYVITDQSIIEL